MDILAGLRRRYRPGGEARRRRPRHGWSPQVTPLEGRTLQTVNGSLGFLKADPPVLAPSGRTVTVHITGEIGANHMDPPAAYYFVTDEYRTYEPHGAGIPLTYDHKKLFWDVFTYSFDIQLPAKRSTRTPDGRHFDLFVGAKDADGTDGLTTQILVPKVYPPVPPHHRGH